MAEDLADYLREMGIKVHYLHSEIDTLERIEILRDLRLGVYDVVVGHQPAARGARPARRSRWSRSSTPTRKASCARSSLIQTIGRAARHVDGQVIMYADTMTGSMQRAIDETYRRRKIQMAYNEEHGITPMGIHEGDPATSRTGSRRWRSRRPSTASAPSMPKDEMPG